MTKQFLKDTLGWGFILWLIGFTLSMILFPFVSTAIMGWIIMPVGIMITLWVLFKKIKGEALMYYLYIGIAWTVIAVIFDYLFIVSALKAAGYYKLDIYLYYILTLSLPIIIGFIKIKKPKG